MHVVKGHGTENDFVLLPDLDGVRPLTVELTRRLCDRRAGVGADGVLRVVRSERDDASREVADRAPYFMDYRNADGSVAEMCGNGVRVFARYLQRAGLIGSETTVATRAGLRRVWLDGDGEITVDMGGPAVLDVRPWVTSAGAEPAAGIALQIPNPHVVVLMGRADALDALDLTRPPRVDPPLPHGQNVEFVVRHGDRHVSMRVYERGVGETRSCGTGVCAAVVAAAVHDGASTGDGCDWRVDVLGGTCHVVWRPDGGVRLRGPAVLVADIDLDERWLEGG